jgi:hypothetical protein
MTSVAEDNQNRKYPGQLNSVQLNIVLLVDVANTLATNSLEGNVFMLDNSPDSPNKGTARLQTVCQQGQVLNWLVYSMDSEQRYDGSWPPSARILNIVVLDETGEGVSLFQAYAQFRAYGAPDKLRSPFTPVYYYVAGTVMPDLPPGNYKYRVILEIDTNDRAATRYMEFGSPSLMVLPLNYKHAASSLDQDSK